jgi:uncharacterized damage-inducible protein DinB
MASVDRTDEIHRIVRLWEETLEGAPYHGPSVLEILENVDAEMASQKASSHHSIWELVLHMAAELEYARTLIDGTAVPWVEDETTWEFPSSVSEAEWIESVERLKTAHRALILAVQKLDEKVLEANPAPVSGTFYRMLHGVMHHNIYHSGQIALMVRQMSTENHRST